MANPRRRPTDDDDLAAKLDQDMSYGVDARQAAQAASDDTLGDGRPAAMSTASIASQDSGWLTAALSTAGKQFVPWSFFSTGTRTSSIDSFASPGQVAPQDSASASNSASNSDSNRYDANHVPSVLSLTTAAGTGSVSSSVLSKSDPTLDFEPTFDGPFIFKAIFLAYWDNLVGPKIEKVWPADTKIDDLLQYVSRYTLNSEIARTALLTDPVDMKFSVLGDQHVAVVSFVFTGSKAPGPPSKHTLCMIVPEAQLQRFMIYFPIIQSRLPPIIDRFRVLQQHRKPNALDLLSTQLSLFSASLQDLNMLALSSDVKLNDTMFGPMYEGYFEKAFQKKLLMSFLQTHGFAIVIGQDVNLINVVVRSLAIFLSPTERKRCRLAHVDCHRLMPELLVQGIFAQDVAEQLSEANLLETSFPVTVVDLSTFAVQRTPIYHEYVMVRNQWLDAELEHLVRDAPPDAAAPATIAMGGLLQIVKDSCPFVDTMLLEVYKLPYALRITYLLESKRLLVRRAVALIKYCEAEIELSAERRKYVLSPQAAKKIRTDLNLLDNNVFWIVLAVAERLRPGTFSEVMEDPVSMEEKFRAMIESF